MSFMDAPGNGLLQLIFAAAFVIASGYAFGRIHQWYRGGTERDAAYRRGYDRASDHMFDLALCTRADEATPLPADISGPLDVGGRTVALVPETAEGRRRQVVGDSRRRIVTAEIHYAARSAAAR